MDYDTILLKHLNGLGVKTLRKHAVSINLPIHHVVDGKKKLMTKKHLINVIHGSGIFSDIWNKLKGVASSVVNRIQGVTSDRSEAPPHVRKFLEEHGNDHIVGIDISREPLNKAITALLSAISLGKTLQTQRKLGYDDLYHLALKLYLSNGQDWRFEKNETVNVMPWKDAPNADYRTIKMTQPLTVQQFYNNAIDYAKRNNVQFFKYNVVHSNCQAFLNVCLTANSKYLKYTPDDKAFIMQDVGAVLAESPYIEGLVGHVTGLRDKINIALNGKGRPKRHVRYTNKLAKRLMV